MFKIPKMSLNMKSRPEQRPFYMELIIFFSIYIFKVFENSMKICQKKFSSHIQIHKQISPNCIKIPRYKFCLSFVILTTMAKRYLSFFQILSFCIVKLSFKIDNQNSKIAEPNVKCRAKIQLQFDQSLHYHDMQQAPLR